MAVTAVTAVTAVMAVTAVTAVMAGVGRHITPDTITWTFGAGRPTYPPHELTKVG